MTADTLAAAWKLLPAAGLRQHVLRQEIFEEEGLMAHWTRRGFIGSLSAAAAAKAFPAPQKAVSAAKRAGQGPIKITDLRCAIIGKTPTVRIVTDQGFPG